MKVFSVPTYRLKIRNLTVYTTPPPVFLAKIAIFHKNNS